MNTEIYLKNKHNINNILLCDIKKCEKKKMKHISKYLKSYYNTILKSILYNNPVHSSTSGIKLKVSLRPIGCFKCLNPLTSTLCKISIDASSSDVCINTMNTFDC